jgi:hypothetical protein
MLVQKLECLLLSSEGQLQFFSHSKVEVQCCEAYRIQNSNRAALHSATGTFQRSNVGKKEVERCQVLEKAQKSYQTKEWDIVTEGARDQAFHPYGVTSLSRERWNTEIRFEYHNVCRIHVLCFQDDLPSWSYITVPEVYTSLLCHN